LEYKGKIISRVKGIPTLLLASLLLIILQGASHYADLNQDEIEAEKLMSCELKIMELNILSELDEAELVMDGMATNIKHHIRTPSMIFNDTQSALMESDIIQAIAVGFKPNYFPDMGYWFEPRCVRVGDQLITEQIGGPDHDYFNMEWYKIGLTNTRGPIRWTKPYFDSSQNNIPLMSLAWPLEDHDTIVGVLCMDVTLMSLKKMLEYAKPYKGSVCQLLDENGKLLVSSDRIELDSSKYLIGVKNMAGHGLRVKLACPKSAIYGHSRVKNTIKLVIIMSALLLIAYITRRSIYNIISLNAAEQKQHDVKNEMRIAHNIQMSILRRDFPDNLSATLLPMQEVGGDLYDFYIRDEKLFFCVGDVSGKGVPASLVMAVTRTMFRTVSAHEDSPRRIVTQMNDSMSDMNESSMFVTFFCGVLDLTTAHLCYCNAGHNPPMVLTDEIRKLPVEANLPLGIMQGMVFIEQEIDLNRDDAIFLYTDGLTEAENAEKEQFGEERVVEALHGRKSSDEHLKNISRQVRLFVGDAPQSDDLTMLFIHYLGADSSAIQVPAVSEHRIVLHNEVSQISQLEGFIEAVAKDRELDLSQTLNLNLALEEAVTNVVLYAYPQGTTGEVDVLARVGVDWIEFVVTDSGKPFDPTAAPAADTTASVNDRRIGGLGIHLVRTIMDSVHYERRGNKNILTMTKNF
jgi:anti-sigma regulatory factor (Ser/Thr protein kinase)